MEPVTIRGDEVKQLVGQHWAGRAPEFDFVPHHGLHSEGQRQAWLGVLSRLAGPEPLRVLDVGCGTGFLALLLAELGHHSNGIDLAAEMVERAKAKAQQSDVHAYFREGDAEALDFPDSSFDLVVARHLIWTLPDPEEAVREWLRVLKPGGRIALVEGSWGHREQVPTEYQNMHQMLPFYGGRPSMELQQFLEGLGVQEIVVEPLMAADLWGEAPQHERYLITGSRAQ